MVQNSESTEQYPIRNTATKTVDKTEETVPPSCAYRCSRCVKPYPRMGKPERGIFVKLDQSLAENYNIELPRPYWT